MSDELPQVQISTSGALLSRALRSPMTVISASVFVVIAAACVAAPLLTAYDPGTASLPEVLAPPGGSHILGADASGRDVWAQLLYGGQSTLLGAVIAVTVALVIGIPTGLVAGFYQGRLGAALDTVSNILISVPTQLVLIALIAAIGPNMLVAMAFLGGFMSPSIYRLLRGTVGAVRKELFIDAARVSGMGDAQILSGHILPVVRGPLVLETAIVAGGAILLQTGIEFLGLGDPSRPSWGSMLDDGFIQLYRQPLLVLWPSLALTATLCAIALFASGMRDLLTNKQPSVALRRDEPMQLTTGPEAAPSDDSLLTIRNLAVSYRQPNGSVLDVVKDVSLSVFPGEILGLVGESGSGKSQTAFATLGLLDPGGFVSAGSIWLAGRQLQPLSKGTHRVLGHQISYVPQEPLSNLNRSFTIGHQLVQPMCKVLGLSRTEARTRALDLLRQVEIRDPEAVMNLYPHQISGGMAQRVLIAGAISCEPVLLIADEPTTALDVTVQAGILQLLRKLRAERGLSMLIVTHNFGVVSDLCDRVAVMTRGRVIETQTVVNLFDSPREPYTRQLLAAGLDGRNPRAGAGAEIEP